MAQDVLVVARDALDTGRPWVARDRLTGALAHRATDQEVLLLLGQAWWELGEPAQAGRYWYLTGRTDVDAERAIAAFERSVRTSEAALGRLPLAGPLEDYPEVARARVNALRRQVRADTVVRQRALARWRRSPERAQSRWGRVLWNAGIAVLVGLTLATWIVGLVTVVRWALT
ncbi:MAG: hypothetical protein LCI03_14955 [Actinobacteria bacterium]|nr:hypothetical protein [Actinomycetota bacterium]